MNAPAVDVHADHAARIAAAARVGHRLAHTAAALQDADALYAYAHAVADLLARWVSSLDPIRPPARALSVQLQVTIDAARLAAYRADCWRLDDAREAMRAVRSGCARLADLADALAAANDTEGDKPQ